MIKDTESSRALEEKGIKSIYVLKLMEKSGADQLVYDNGKESGFPDTGCMYSPGFYYDLNDAIEAMHENAADIRECCYNYGFVIRLYPGMYNSACKDNRIYFAWDDNKKGFFEADEPELFGIIALDLG